MSNATSTDTIVVAMSGGVDSSTVAGLLHRQGARIIGLTMQLWNQRRLPELAGDAPVAHRCCSLDDVYDARRVAEHCGFPYYVVNFERQFEAAVVRPFVENYLAGRTPIPCAQCNTAVKFDELLVTARQIGAERLATGHYARVSRNDATCRWELWRARDAAKDQSYFLFGLTQEQLARTLFPLGELTKAEVRETARELRLPVAEKPESQEICFVPSGDYAQFISAYLEEQGSAAGETSGEILTTEGEVVGAHAGVHQFTVGQRRGLGLSTGQPKYVVRIEPESRRLVVGDDCELFRDTCEVDEVNWISVERLDAPVRAEVKIRHRHEPAPAWVEPVPERPATGEENDGMSAALPSRRVRLRFDAPQRAITPGQAAVFYQGESVLGGGWIR
ncbi:MAG TPA: tRNA 2-thiouridine(34) synthase MnmA [Candidatus Acidoferrales bacterium]|nr:tRNA 2-thiouridine(34) synthase MnmA [Candidatus Acidoferrales bacterium]